jgi:predicted metalloendopeptidase
MGEDNCTSWFWAIGFTLLFIALIVLIAVNTQPYPYPYYRNASPINTKDGLPRLNCTVGERYDADLGLCAPIINTPVPISNDLIDNSVPICQSFFNHMSGKWIESHKNENRAFTYVYKKNQKQVHDIILDPTTGPIHRLYKSCVDTIVYRNHKFLDRAQLNHVKEHILGALQTHADLPIVFARLAMYGFTSPFVFTIEPHPTELLMIPLIRKDQFLDETNILTLASQFGFTPDQMIRLTEVLGKIDAFEDPKKSEWDGSFIEYVQSPLYEQDLIEMKVLLDASPVNFWKLYLRELNGYSMEEDIEKSYVWLLDRNYLTSLLHEMNNISVDQWKLYVEFSIMYNANQFVPSLPSDSYFRIHNALERKSKHRMHRKLNDERVNEETCMQMTHKLLPGMIGNVFLERSMKNHQAIKTKVTQIVENVRDTFAYIIQNTSWLGPASKGNLTEKIRNIIVRTVTPNYYEEEAVAERITSDNYLRNLNIIRRYLVTKNFELWTNEKPNRDFIERFHAPLTQVNAFYSPSTNTITIFGGILHKPFYDDSFPTLAVYATVGMIAAHEIGHALDNHGRLFDKDGSLYRTDPWDSREILEFEKRTHCLIEEYEAPFGCENANYGQQTLGEDMSDLVGLKAAYLAYFMNTEEGRKADKQKKRWFFQIFAQMWAETYEQEAYCDRVSNDVHAIAMMRVDKTLRQMIEFREAFGCKDGDGMVNTEACVVYGQ